MSDLQAQPQQQTVAQNKSGQYEAIHNLIHTHGTIFLSITTYAACVVAFPLLTFFLTLHEVYGGDIDQAKFAALKMAGFVTVMYVLAYIINKKTSGTNSGDEAKKDQ